MDETVEVLYTKYAPMVYRRCLKLLRDEEQARDAMHDVFAKVLQKQSVLQFRYPCSLLYTMATNHCLNLIKRKRFEATDDIALLVEAAPDEEERILLRHFLDRIFHGHRPNTRTMACLYFVDGWKQRDIAREFGMSVAGVKKRLKTFRKTAVGFREKWYEKDE